MRRRFRSRTAILDDRLIFPPLEEADSRGLLAIGGDLRPERLELAYRSGIFPWYSEDTPILWFSPDPRMVLPVPELRVNRSLRKAIRKKPYKITADRAFGAVIHACSLIPRPGQDGTWITDDMKDAYLVLHERGLAHSFEAWEGETLVGGLYGVSLGAAFFGESMFALAPNASKIAFVSAVSQFLAWGFTIIDCQMHTPYLEHFGGREWPRSRFLATLDDALARPTRLGPWLLEPAICEDLSSFISVFSQNLSENEEP